MKNLYIKREFFTYFCMKIMLIITTKRLIFLILILINKVFFGFRMRGAPSICSVLSLTCPRLFQITNLMHNSFILQQYVCYTTAVQYAGWERTAVRSPPAYCTAVYRGWRYQRLWWYNWPFWGWARCCSKHVEERSVTYSVFHDFRA